MDIYLIANPKGGVGKSTLATNLAGWFARNGNRVMLGDVDRQQSSLSWLRLRSPALPFISSWHLEAGKPARPPKGITHVVLDSPAGMHGKKLNSLLQVANRVIVPLQPSIFDILATQTFLQELRQIKRVRREATRIAIVAMKVNRRTRSSDQLERFLEEIDIPVIASLRDTHNYVHAAAHGHTIFDLPEKLVAQDLEQWIPLLRWADPLRNAG